MQDVSHESKATISKRLDFKVCTELTILHGIKSDATWDRMLHVMKHGFISLSQNPKVKAWGQSIRVHLSKKVKNPMTSRRNHINSLLGCFCMFLED